MPALYIADGHHRAASAARARAQLGSAGASGGSAECDRFLAVAFSDKQVQILPYNRVIKDLGGLSPSDFLAALRIHCSVESGGPSPAGKGRVAMYLDGRWYQLDLRQMTAAGGAVDALDVSILQEQVFSQLLRLGDVRTDKRIDFVGGARGTAELERQVDSGRAAVAFSLYPVRSPI